MSTNEYPATRRDVSTDDLLAALIPDTPAAAESPVGHSTAQLLELARRQGGLAGTPEHRPGTLLPAVPVAPAAPAGPLIPRWAAGVAVAAPAVGVGAVGVGYALRLIGSAVHAMEMGAAAIGGPLVILTVLALGVAGRRGRGSTVITMTQTTTYRR